jgi:hypothetical protein
VGVAVKLIVDVLVLDALAVNVGLIVLVGLAELLGVAV